MSKTFSLICEETKKRIWVGQGHGSMLSFYSGDPKVMATLTKFLNDHQGKNLKFVCDDTNDYIFDYEAYEG